MVISFTGHRPDKLGGYGDDNPVRARVENALTQVLLRLLREHGSERFRALSGMALGFDQWAAQICIEMGIKVTAFVPFAGQDRMWSYTQKTHYQLLLSLCDRIEVVSDGGYAPWKMQRRNIWMVDQSDLLVAAWDGSDGGTANCVGYAETVGRKVEKLSW